MRRRTLAGALGATALTGCAGPTLLDHAGEQPAFDFRGYFDGTVTAHGIVADRGGKVLRRFVATLQCRWSGDSGTLAEEFVFDDGERQRRVWRVQQRADGGFTGRADDVVGEAVGTAAGAAFNWRYTLRLPVRGSVYEVQFDDWLYRIDDRTVLNKATMSKFGVRLGELTLAFAKR